jgi:hypothetical protein
LRHKNTSLALDKYYRNAHTVCLLETVCQLWDLVDISPEQSLTPTQASYCIHMGSGDAQGNPAL